MQRALMMSILRYFTKTDEPSHPLLPKPWTRAEESANNYSGCGVNGGRSSKKAKRLIQLLRSRPQSKNKSLLCRKRQQGHCKLFFNGTGAGISREYCTWHEVELSPRVGEDKRPSGG